MRPFRFRLARFLRLNEAEKRQYAIALAQENRALDLEQDAFDRRVAQHNQIEQQYANLAARPASVTDWIIAERALTGAKTEVRKQSQAVRKAEARVETAREVLVHKSSEVETLKRLRERRRQEYDVLYRRDEQKHTDESAVGRFTHSRRSQSG